jgi:hypothetical protein
MSTYFISVLGLDQVVISWCVHVMVYAQSSRIRPGAEGESIEQRREVMVVQLGVQRPHDLDIGSAFGARRE